MITNKNELAAALRIIHKYQVMENEVKQAKELVKQYLLDNNLATATAGGFSATVKQVDSRRFNSSAFKAAEPTLYDKYTVTDTQTRLYIK